ncbi:hypothetical protein HAZT_HAZT000793 [Hyalella azteca]|uniref:PiggyBac transposable element-derived protein domain-containing protein n=1 Tax=Hyalella azteca TaxID=294128 RepID=A0A6A0H1T3_HYAAZ|nr:hypothetical protein HAZT_HAZT000793 [Hyalella azteca]
MGDFAKYLCYFQFSTSRFYQKNQTHTTVVPLDPSISDDDSLDDDISDLNYMPVPDPHNEDTPDTTEGQPPTSKRRCRRPVLEEVHEEDVEEDMDTATPQEKRSTTNKVHTKKKRGKLNENYKQSRPTTWSKIDISNPPLPEYQHIPPQYVKNAECYFEKFFNLQLIQHITYQTNLYATQKDVSTTFATTDEEIRTFIAILLYMGVAAPLT